MKITNSMIDEELRTAGILIKMINPTFTEGRLRLFAKLKYQLICRDKSIDLFENYIPRKDGSNLRLCIFRPKDINGG